MPTWYLTAFQYSKTFSISSFHIKTEASVQSGSFLSVFNGKIKLKKKISRKSHTVHLFCCNYFKCRKTRYIFNFL